MIRACVMAGIACLSLLPAVNAVAQDPCASEQSQDLSYRAPVDHPTYPDKAGRSPLVVVDSAHHNFHTATGRYAPFATVLRQDGYRVEDSGSRYSVFGPGSLSGIDVLVIANALHESNIDPDSCAAKWRLPTPSAFTDDEINTVKRWVEQGGSLLLIIDHMPFPGAAEKLADAFGITTVNGYSFPIEGTYRIEFGEIDGASDASLPRRGILHMEHPILQMADSRGDRVTPVVSFTGSSFWLQAGVAGQPLLEFADGVYTYLNADHDSLASKSLAGAPRILSKGLLQGATVLYGKGKVAVFGEAAMFSAQTVAGNGGQLAIGMSDPAARNNYRFLLNVLCWLSDGCRERGALRGSGAPQ